MIGTALTQSAGSHREESDYRMILLGTGWLRKSDMVATLPQFSRLSSEWNLVFFAYSRADSNTIAISLAPTRGALLHLLVEIEKSVGLLREPSSKVLWNLTAAPESSLFNSILPLYLPYKHSWNLSDCGGGDTFQLIHCDPLDCREIKLVSCNLRSIGMKEMSVCTLKEKYFSELRWYFCVYTPGVIRGL